MLREINWNLFRCYCFVLFLKFTKLNAILIMTLVSNRKRLHRNFCQYKQASHNNRLCHNHRLRFGGKWFWPVPGVEKKGGESCRKHANCQYGACRPSGYSICHALYGNIHSCWSEMDWGSDWTSHLQICPFLLSNIDTCLNFHSLVGLARSLLCHLLSDERTRLSKSQVYDSCHLDEFCRIRRSIYDGKWYLHQK